MTAKVLNFFSFRFYHTKTHCQDEIVSDNFRIRVPNRIRNNNSKATKCKCGSRFCSLDTVGICLFLLLNFPQSFFLHILTMYAGLKCYQCIDNKNTPGLSCGDFDASKETTCPTSQFCVKETMKADGTKTSIHGCGNEMKLFSDSNGIY